MLFLFTYNNTDMWHILYFCRVPCHLCYIDTSKGLWRLKTYVICRSPRPTSTSQEFWAPKRWQIGRNIPKSGGWWNMFILARYHPWNPWNLFCFAWRCRRCPLFLGWKTPKKQGQDANHNRGVWYLYLVHFLMVNVGRKIYQCCIKWQHMYLGFEILFKSKTLSVSESIQSVQIF